MCVIDGIMCCQFPTGFFKKNTSIHSFIMHRPSTQSECSTETSNRFQWFAEIAENDFLFSGGSTD
jgi:hypothetical protein